MTRVRFTLPEVKSMAGSRPDNCPYCQGSVFQRHGRVEKAIKDLKVGQVAVYRYRCTDCGRTFRHYPQGVEHHDQSQRLRALAALLWALGLSHQSISYLLTALGSEIAKMTSWRDVQEAGEALSRGRKVLGKVEIIGADETVVKVKGGKMLVGFVVAPDSGEVLGLELLLEQDAGTFLKWLRPYVEEYGVQVALLHES